MARISTKRVALLALGWGFVLLGILGLFLPILQGILFILVGLTILSSEHSWAQRVLERLKARFPSVARRSAEASAKARVWLRRIGRRESSSRHDRYPGQ